MTKKKSDTIKKIKPKTTKQKNRKLDRREIENTGGEN